MKTFNQPKKETPKAGRLSIFDVDDTLFHTTAQISVMKDGSVMGKLSNQEFNSYILKDGESFDFLEFSNSSKFYHESTPIARMLDRAKAILSHSLRNPNSKVIIVTARANFDNKELFLDTFRKHRFDIDKVRVERAGNILDVHDVVLRKCMVIRNYLKSGKFDRCSLFDDSMSNLHGFLGLRAEFPNTKFEAYYAGPTGSIKIIK
jgi:hypothetical protein